MLSNSELRVENKDGSPREENRAVNWSLIGKVLIPAYTSYYRLLGLASVFFIIGRDMNSDKNIAFDGIL